MGIAFSTAYEIRCIGLVFLPCLHSAANKLPTLFPLYYSLFVLYNKEIPARTVRGSSW